MRKIIAILCLIVMILCLVGCDSEVEKTAIESCIESYGFVLIDKLGENCGRYTCLVYDSRTKVEYIFTSGYNETSFCPYYDENGEVAIYKGE